MWLTGFKFKLTSLLFGIEFGPEKEEKKPKESEKKNLLMIENALQKLEVLQIELSKNIDNTNQKPALGLPAPGPSGDHSSKLAVENINSRESDSDGFDCVNDFNGQGAKE